MIKFIYKILNAIFPRSWLFDLPLAQYHLHYQKWLEAGYALSEAKHKYTATDFEILMDIHIANEPSYSRRKYYE